uniref:PNPLA domain-containing protein n=1 Tax=viral metagenome TaxID=1070528 RepID=A0A6C0AYA2_9ZZZZ|tara:strand:- start:12975 stop:13598 length:624 start_codon:yes stop_codon:yes gene_type:complete
MKPKHFFILLFAISNLFKYFISEYEKCVMIGYGGYSGFWYYYSNLQKSYILDKNIYCYSAGCLATVASIQHNNYDSLIRMVKTLKNKYNNNEIDRFDIRNEFIYEISQKVTDIKYYNINILTSSYYGNCNIIRPINKKQLIDALNMTSSVPFFTSKLDISKNIDGFFCLNKYPKCKEKLTMPNSLYFYINILNHNINDEDISYIMNL